MCGRCVVFKAGCTCLFRVYKGFYSAQRTLHCNPTLLRISAAVLPVPFRQPSWYYCGDFALGRELKWLSILKKGAADSQMISVLSLLNRTARYENGLKLGRN